MNSVTPPGSWSQLISSSLSARHPTRLAKLNNTNDWLSRIAVKQGESGSLQRNGCYPISILPSSKVTNRSDPLSPGRYAPTRKSKASVQIQARLTLPVNQRILRPNRSTCVYICASPPILEGPASPPRSQQSDSGVSGTASRLLMHHSNPLLPPYRETAEKRKRRDFLGAGAGLFRLSRHQAARGKFFRKWEIFSTSARHIGHHCLDEAFSGGANLGGQLGYIIMHSHNMHALRFTYPPRPRSPSGKHLEADSIIRFG